MTTLPACNRCGQPRHPNQLWRGTCEHCRRHTCTQHQPGSNACYGIHQCRCKPCRDSRSRTAKAARNRAATGRGLMPATRILHHLNRLRVTMGTLDIAEASGLAHGTITGIRAGRNVRHSTAAAILAVKPGNGSGKRWVDGTGTRRRLQALAAIGWANREIAAAIGATHHQLVWQWQTRPGMVTTETRERVAAVYDALWMVAPRGPAVDAVRLAASRRGYVSPLAWDDGVGPFGIDNPAARPHGTHAGRKSHGTAAAEVRHLLGTDSGDNIAKRLGYDNLDNLAKTIGYTDRRLAARLRAAREVA